jgi:hypothetical protein
MPASQNKGEAGKPKGDPKPSGGAVWDPAAFPTAESPTLRDEEERAFHATHFSADPRGASMAGKPPPDAGPKHRGGTPPPAPANEQAEQRPRRRKRRGGAAPRRSGPADV